jgi:hypothetical protein
MRRRERPDDDCRTPLEPEPHDQIKFALEAKILEKFSIPMDLPKRAKRCRRGNLHRRRKL